LDLDAEAGLVLGETADGLVERGAFAQPGAQQGFPVHPLDGQLGLAAGRRAGAQVALRGLALPTLAALLLIRDDHGEERLGAERSGGLEESAQVGTRAAVPQLVIAPGRVVADPFRRAGRRIAWRISHARPPPRPP